MTESQDSELVVAHTPDEVPGWTDLDEVARFFHETMRPWHDTLEDVHRGLDYAFSPAEGKGGYLVLAREEGRLAGALLMLRTGMGGYVPDNILLFVSVDPDMRGRGLGRRIIQRALDEADGTVKLHVEYENPAKRLYERIGFTTRYAEMRYER